MNLPHGKSLLLLGDLPHEQALARHVDTLLSDPTTNWLPAPTNAYVLAKHVLCAATEQPLTEASLRKLVQSEVDRRGRELAAYKRVGRIELTDTPLPKTALQIASRQ